MTTAADVRAQLLDALRLDLVGPAPEDPAHERYQEEQLPVAPSLWYLTGFLVPYEAPAERRSDDDADDQLDLLSPGAEGDDEVGPERASARKAFFPSSMGLSVLLPETAQALEVRVDWGDYLALPEEGNAAPDAGADGNASGNGGDATGSERGGRGRWRREPRVASLTLPIQLGAAPRSHDVPDSHGLRIVASVRESGGRAGLPGGVLSVSVFIVNHRRPAEDFRRDAAYVFQPRLTLRCPQGFVARPDVRGSDSEDWDETVADLQYRDVCEYGVGHNVSALAVHEAAGPCHEVRTAWMPTAAVERIEPRDIPGAQLCMEALAAAGSGEEVRRLLAPLTAGYGAWIADQRQKHTLEGHRAQVADEMLDRADRVRRRIDEGLCALDDPHVLEAFRIANRAVARAIRQRASHGKEGVDPDALEPPRWRPFQLAFMLMTISGVAEGEHADRRVVDLLFFPTGGGKTEAYLGLAAFTMVLRRLRDPSVRSAGVSVIMRYTLRLLTLDQLERAA
ncbi:MAG: hypothetical protein Q8N53_19805, partial [Longimicrobiales bacterium]|nr:hypothetical protein [Longimicrobiales bacterium]